MPTNGVTSMTETKGKKADRPSEAFFPRILKLLGKYKTPYIFISPFFILYAIFGIYPAIYSVFLSLFEGRGRMESNFVGFNNYIRFF